MLLSYCVLGLDSSLRGFVFNTYDANKDGTLTRLEFCEFCRDLLWRVPEPVLQNAMHNLAEARLGKNRANTAYWKAMATKLDKVARVIVPALYFFALAVRASASSRAILSAWPLTRAFTQHPQVVFSLDMSDGYDGGAPMFKGLGPTGIKIPGLVRAVDFDLSAPLCPPAPSESIPTPFESHRWRSSSTSSRSASAPRRGSSCAAFTSAMSRALRRSRRPP